MCLAVLDARHDQLAVAVLALQVDREPEVDVLGGDRVRLAVHFGEVPVHVRELLDRLHQRVADQVRERDLAAAGALEVVVDDDPVVDHQLGRDGPHAGRGRHFQRSRHVLDHCGRRPAQYLNLGALRRRRRRLRLGGRGSTLGLGGLRCGCGERSCVSALVSGLLSALDSAGFGGGAGAGSGGATGADVRCPLPGLGCRWSARGSSRRGIHANWDLPTRDPRGTCDTSPRPTTRSVRMVKVSSR